MTGPEHYAEAEAQLIVASESFEGDDAAYYLARAQVHATLALAAATAETTMSGMAYGYGTDRPEGAVFVGLNKRP
jgi:hypothetical protein